MIEPAIVVTRWLQYSGAAVLFGLPLFLIYAGSAAGSGLRSRKILAATAALVAVASLMAIGLQASLFGESLSDGFSPEAFTNIVAYMSLGKAALVRAVAAGLALVLLAAGSPGRPLWLATAALGGVAAASLAWMGHGAATEGTAGTVHLAADIVHCLAAGIWVGFLLGFTMSLAVASDRAAFAALHRALAGFASIGTVLVALLLATGLVNAWFLVGPAPPSALLSTPYGRWLALKIALFLAMLGLAAANRFILTPRLAAQVDGTGPLPSLAALRRSVALETALGVGILALVAWLGTLAPPIAS